MDDDEIIELRYKKPQPDRIKIGRQERDVPLTKWAPEAPSGINVTDAGRWADWNSKSSNSKRYLPKTLVRIVEFSTELLEGEARTRTISESFKWGDEYAI